MRYSKHISFDEVTYKRLEQYIMETFGNKNVISAIVIKAINDYLDKQNLEANSKYK